MKISSILMLFVMFNSLSIYAQEFDYSFKEEYKTSAPVKLSIASSDSDIEVISHDKNVIEVYFIVKKGRKILDIDKSQLQEELKEQSILEIQNTENELRIKVTSTIKSYIKFKDAINIDFVVYTPNQTSSDLISSDGDILLKGLKSNQNCITSDGDIILKGLFGDIKAKTSDGNIELNDSTGNVTAKASDGDIKLTKLKGNVMARTSDGDIKLTKLEGDVIARTSDGNILIDGVIGKVDSKTIEGKIINLNR